MSGSRPSSWAFALLGVTSAVVVACDPWRWETPAVPTAQGAYQVTSGEPTGCTVSGHSSKVGDVTSTQRNAVVIDGTDGSAVACSVAGVGPFSVTGRIQRGGDSLQISVPALSATATKQAPSKGQVDYVWATTGKHYIADAAHPCDFYFVSGAKEAVMAGKVWIAFTCDAISAEQDTCSLLESYVILENCAQ